MDTKFSDDWSNIVKKQQQFFEIQDGGSSHLEKYSSDWTIIATREIWIRSL